MSESSSTPEKQNFHLVIVDEVETNCLVFEDVTDLLVAYYNTKTRNDVLFCACFIGHRIIPNISNKAIVSADIEGETKVVEL